MVPSSGAGTDGRYVLVNDEPGRPPSSRLGGLGIRFDYPTLEAGFQKVLGALHE